MGMNETSVRTLLRLPSVDKGPVTPSHDAGGRVTSVPVPTSRGLPPVSLSVPLPHRTTPRPSFPEVGREMSPRLGQEQEKQLKEKERGRGEGSSPKRRSDTTDSMGRGESTLVV